MTRYYTRPRLAPRAEWFDEAFYCNDPLTPNLTVFEPAEPHVDSGLLNADGEPLYRATMGRIGFDLNAGANA